MKSLWLAGALALGLTASAVTGGAIAAPDVHGIPAQGGNGGVHGIIINHHCRPGHWSRWCRCHPSRWNNWCRPRGIIIGHPIGRVVGHPIGVVVNHPIGVPAQTVPGHVGPVNGIPAEQRVQH